MQNTAPISGLSETSSDSDDTESELDNRGMIEEGIAESLFVTGVLDELKICFSYSYQVSLLPFACFSFIFEFPHELKMSLTVV